MEIQYNATGGCWELADPNGERHALSGFATWEEARAYRDEMEND